jgi:hypothetical protein
MWDDFMQWGNSVLEGASSVLVAREERKAEAQRQQTAITAANALAQARAAERQQMFGFTKQSVWLFAGAGLVLALAVNAARGK